MSGDIQLIMEDTVVSLDTNASGAAAEEAAAAASEAGQSAQAASQSATNAHTSETNAATSAQAASQSATNAHTSETNAAQSASSASQSATTATTQATTATNAASAASQSKTNAHTSETNAAQSATTANQDATTATNAATAASQSATNAHTSETNAATSASAAATSAQQAQASAGSVAGYKYNSNVYGIANGATLDGGMWGAFGAYTAGDTSPSVTVAAYPGTNGFAGWIANLSAVALTVNSPAGIVFYLSSEQAVHSLTTITLLPGEWMEVIAVSSTQYKIRIVSGRMYQANIRNVTPAVAPLKAIAGFFVSKSGIETGTAGNDYGDLLTMNGWPDTSGGWMNALLGTKTGAQRLYHHIAQQTDAHWAPGRPLAYADGDALTGNYSVAGKLSAQNSPNLVINGAGELGFTGWSAGAFSVALDSNNQSYFTNTAAFTGNPLYSYTDFLPASPGQIVSVQGLIGAPGLTAGNFTAGVEFQDNSGNVIGANSIIAHPGDATSFKTVSSTAPANTVKMRFRMGVTASPVGPANSVYCNRIKAEFGSTNSLYSNEATLAYLRQRVEAAFHGTLQFVASSQTAVALRRYNGPGALVINGTVQYVPDTPITAPNTGLSANTTYFVYAYWTGSAIAMEFSATLPVRDSTTGVQVKTGDATRTLVGMVRTNASSQFSIVRSWFNRVSQSALANATDTFSATTMTGPIGGVQIGVLMWGDETANFNALGTMVPAGGITAAVQLFVDSAQQGQAQDGSAYTAGAGIPIGLSLAVQLAIGYHTLDLRGTSNGASTTFYATLSAMVS